MQYKIKTDRKMKEYNDIILTSLAKSATDVIGNIAITLMNMLPNIGDRLMLKNISEDYTFADYDGNNYAIVGIEKGELHLSLLGYAFDDMNNIDKSKLYKFKPYMYDSVFLLNVVRAFENDYKVQQEENEDD